MVYRFACSNPTRIFAHSYSLVTTSAGGESTRSRLDVFCSSDGFASGAADCEKDRARLYCDLDDSAPITGMTCRYLPQFCNENAIGSRGAVGVRRVPRCSAICAHLEACRNDIQLMLLSARRDCRAHNSRRYGPEFVFRRVYETSRTGRFEGWSNCTNITFWNTCICNCAIATRSNINMHLPRSRNGYPC